MKLEFERPDYCEGCLEAEYIIETTTLFAADEPSELIHKLICSKEKTCPRQMDWEKAISHLNELIAICSSLGPTGRFALIYGLYPLQDRYLKGERSKKLFEEIMDCH